MQTLNFTAMASQCEVQLDEPESPETQQVLQQVHAEVLRIQNKYSRYRTDSVVCQINARAGKASYACDSETAALLNFADRLHQQFHGVFDLTSGVLRQAWDFSANRLPGQQILSELMPLIGWHKVQWNGHEIHLPQIGMEIDLGGIGKEYAVDRAAHLLQAAGYKSALINFGGDVFATGPKQDGSSWQVGIRHPRKPDQIIAVIPMNQGGLATSGDYERYMEIDGKRYSHLLNAKTGWPVNYWQSISVLAPTCMMAGAMSTTFMLLEENATPLLQTCGLHSLCISSQSLIHKFPQAPVRGA